VHIGRLQAMLFKVLAGPWAGVNVQGFHGGHCRKAMRPNRPAIRARAA